MVFLPIFKLSHELLIIAQCTWSSSCQIWLSSKIPLIWFLWNLPEALAWKNAEFLSPNYNQVIWDLRLHIASSLSNHSFNSVLVLHVSWTSSKLDCCFSSHWRCCCRLLIFVCTWPNSFLSSSPIYLDINPYILRMEIPPPKATHPPKLLTLLSHSFHLSTT